MVTPWATLAELKKKKKDIQCCSVSTCDFAKDIECSMYDAWKAQYANVVCPLPLQADIQKHEHLFNPRLKLSPLLKKPKGPRKNARTRTYVSG